MKSEWICASAGTGKTRALTEKTLSLLLQGQNNILCLTFTKAAALEIKHRIITSLVEKARESKRHYHILSHLIEEKIKLEVTTIHSFCKKIIEIMGGRIKGLTDSPPQEVKELISELILEEPSNSIWAPFYSLIADKIKLPDDSLDLKNYLNEILALDSFPNSYNQNRLHPQIIMQCLSSGSKRDQEHAQTISLFLNKHTDLESYINLFVKCDGVKSINYLSTKASLDKNPELARLLKEESEYCWHLKIGLEANKAATNTLGIVNLYQAYSFFINKHRNTFNIYTYDDLIRLALILIKKREPWLSFYLNRTLDHLLIDEAQDNSPEQWEIIKSLDLMESEKSIFVVGDLKQSIYSFQGADPEFFTATQSYYQDLLKENLITSDLQTSFRSTPNILRFVDQVMQSQEKFKKIYHLSTKKAGKEVEIWQNHTSDIELAEDIGNKIHEWIEKKREIKGRQIAPSDIMIIVRHRSDIVSQIESKLIELNIQVMNRTAIAKQKNIPLESLMSIINFLITEERENLQNLLHLLQLTNDSSEHSYGGLIVPDHIYQLIISFTDNFSKMRPKEFCLFILAAIFPHCYDKTLLKLISFIIELSDEGWPEILTKLSLQENLLEQEGVIITTAHSAKGLQSPIVFLVDSNSLPHCSQVIYDQNGVPFVGSNYSHPYLISLRESAKKKVHEEYLRLLYVALTRAEEELYICSSKSIQTDSWYDIITKAKLS